MGSALEPTPTLIFESGWLGGVVKRHHEAVDEGREHRAILSSAPNSWGG
jgi:hypothetical protein